MAPSGYWTDASLDWPHARGRTTGRHRDLRAGSGPAKPPVLPLDLGRVDPADGRDPRDLLDPPPAFEHLRPREQLDVPLAVKQQLDRAAPSAFIAGT
jgi:hypothetical protein